jgi:NitT/TauT family transport system substrate-binding protein
MLHLKRNSGLAFVVGIAMLVAACGGAPAASPAVSSQASTQPSAAATGKPAVSSSITQQRVAIRYGLLASVAGAITFVPVETGEMAAQGLDVSISQFTDTVQIMVQVAGGQLDMGTITIGAAAFNALNRGLDIKILASSTQNPAGHGSVVPALARTDMYDSGALNNPAQLKGRKFALNAKGTVLEYALAKLMARDGLKTSDVDLVLMPFPDMVAAFGNKSIEAAMMLEPAATTAIVKGVGKLLSDDHIAGAQLAMVAVNGKFAEQHRDAMERFLQLHLQAARKFDDGGLKRDAPAMAIVENVTKVPNDITRQVPDPYWPKDGKVNLQSLEDQQNYYLQAKSVDYTQAVPLSQFIDYSYLDNVLKRIGS